MSWRDGSHVIKVKTKMWIMVALIWTICIAGIVALEARYSQ